MLKDWDLGSSVELIISFLNTEELSKALLYAPKAKDNKGFVAF